MNSLRRVVFILSLICLPTANVLAQAPYLFRMTFSGTVYQTNTTGQVVVTPITHTNLLLAAAAAGGTSDISSMAMVYHIMGDPDHGDTIEIFDTSTGQSLTTLFGLYFGDDTTLGRTALTNSPGTEIRRLDYIYMFDNNDYISPNSHSMGACFTTKRFLGDANGNVHTTINGQMQWIVNPYNGSGTKICIGTFTTTKPF